MVRQADPDWVLRRLRDALGPVPQVASDPVETLVLTILSQNTTDVNRDRAYGSLMARFGSADAIADAEVEEIAAAVSPAGLQCQKAASIRAVLRRVRAREGSLDLSFLGRMSTEEALAWLLASPGVGEKTASIVLLFSFGRPVFPVDTHIRRILNRLGWIAGSGSPYRQANELLPKDASRMRDLHLLLIELGRRICRARRADCAICPLAERCDSSGRVRAGVS